MRTARRDDPRDQRKMPPGFKEDLNKLKR